MSWPEFSSDDPTRCARCLRKAILTLLYREYGKAYRKTHDFVNLEFGITTLRHMEIYSFNLSRDIRKEKKVYQNFNRYLLKLMHDSYSKYPLLEDEFNLILDFHLFLDGVIDKGTSKAKRLYSSTSD